MGETEYQEALKLGKKNISPVFIADVSISSGSG